MAAKAQAAPSGISDSQFSDKVRPSFFFVSIGMCTDVSLGETYGS